MEKDEQKTSEKKADQPKHQVLVFPPESQTHTFCHNVWYLHKVFSSTLSIVELFFFLFVIKP